ncbi:MAG: glucose 1-dehydrogenase [Beijerinckiaceae bacterium]
MSDQIFRLDGKTALVTGSGQGIGLAIAQGLARAGAHVVLNGRDGARLAGTLAAMKAEGLQASACICDVTDQAAVDAAIAGVESASGGIDILVNNAGIQIRAPFTEFPRSEWDRMIATNLSSVFYVSQAVAKGMVARKRGKIINIGSVMCELGRPSIIPYTATKGAIKMMTRGMCAELGKHNIQVNAIGPGYIVTELNRALLADATFDGWVKARTPAGRWGETDELIGAAVFLASPASNFVNGHLLMVDGGMTSVV